MKPFNLKPHQIHYCEMTDPCGNSPTHSLSHTQDTYQWIYQFMILGGSTEILKLEFKELGSLNERDMQGSWVPVFPLSVFIRLND